MRRGLILSIAMLVSLALAASAQANATVTSFSANPSTTLAGGHPDFTTSIRLSYSNTTDDVRSVETALPPGLIGNPNNVGKCTLAQLNADACPANSKIGTTSSIARPVVGPLPLPTTTAPGDVYNVVPTGTEPARIGLVLRPLGGLLGKFALSGPANVRIPGDFGLNVRFDNLPRSLPALNGAAPIPVQVLGLDLKLNGLVGGKSFMTNPTSCSSATTKLNVTTYENATAVPANDSFTPTDCAHVPFDPKIGFWFSDNRANTETALLAGISVPANDLPRAQSHIKSTTSILPAGTQVNFPALANITPCTDAQLNVASGSPPSCPVSSKIGQTVIYSPVVGVRTGDIFFAAATATQPLRLFITIRITPTQTAKFVIVNSLVPSNGALLIRADLANLPQVPQTGFVLGFNRSPNALLKTPPTCGTKYGLGAFFPYSLGQYKVNFAPATVSRQANGTPCSAPAVARVSKPKLSAVTR